VRDDRTSGRGRDIVVILALLGLALFASPFTDWWARASFPWYFPFLLWGLLIVLVVAAQILGHGFED